MPIPAALAAAVKVAGEAAIRSIVNTAVKTAGKTRAMKTVRKAGNAVRVENRRLTVKLKNVKTMEEKAEILARIERNKKAIDALDKPEQVLRKARKELISKSKKEFTQIKRNFAKMNTATRKEYSKYYKDITKYERKYRKVTRQVKGKYNKVKALQKYLPNHGLAMLENKIKAEFLDVVIDVIGEIAPDVDYVFLLSKRDKNFKFKKWAKEDRSSLNAFYAATKELWDRKGVSYKDRDQVIMDFYNVDNMYDAVKTLSNLTGIDYFNYSDDESDDPDYNKYLAMKMAFEIWQNKTGYYYYND